jgi:hypothetical protein
MTITAKFESRCPKCGELIIPGSKVNWERGRPASHVACPEITPDVIADRLLNEYDALQAAKAVAAAPAVAAPSIPKGIYRVSLTGVEKRYGVDHVNLALVPNEKYGSIKVSEWQGESIGRVGKDGKFVFWPSFEDRTATRTYALLAALDIVRGSADPVEYAKAYAKESETCWRCGADLVDEQSRERLMGPVCYRNQYGKGA